MMNIVRAYFEHYNVSGYVDEYYDADCPFSTEPREFLEYAEADLSSSEPQASANYLSNSKRALDCQLDFFLDAYGLSIVSTQQKWSTARKIEIVGDIGGVPKGILHRINQARNDLEHRYQPPNRMTAENAIDVVGLFIDATDFYLHPVREGVDYDHLSFQEKKVLRLELSSKSGIISVGSRQKDGSSKQWDERDIHFEVIAADSLCDYLYLLSFILHAHRLGMKNAELFFRRLKYVNQPTHDGN